MNEIRSFPEASDLFRQIHLLEEQIVKLAIRLEELEAKFEEIRQQPLVHIDYYTDVASTDKSLEEFIIDNLLRIDWRKLDDPTLLKGDKS